MKRWRRNRSLTEAPLVKEFGKLLRGLGVRSQPETRFARHLLHLDLNDTWRFAWENPGAVQVYEAEQ
jgi:hypothetical protein